MTLRLYLFSLKNSGRHTHFFSFLLKRLVYICSPCPIIVNCTSHSVSLLWLLDLDDSSLSVLCHTVYRLLFSNFILLQSSHFCMLDVYMQYYHRDQRKESPRKLVGASMYFSRMLMLNLYSMGVT